MVWRGSRRGRNPFGPGDVIRVMIQDSRHYYHVARITRVTRQRVYFRSRQGNEVFVQHWNVRFLSPSPTPETVEEEEEEEEIMEEEEEIVEEEEPEATATADNAPIPRVSFDSIEDNPNVGMVQGMMLVEHIEAIVIIIANFHYDRQLMRDLIKFARRAIRVATNELADEFESYISREN